MTQLLRQRQRKIILPNGTITLLGLGNHTFPYSRNSVGSYMIGLLGKRLGVEFIHSPYCAAHIGYYPEENLLLVRPDTYLVEDNKEAVSRLFEKFSELTLSTMLVVHHETTIPLGEVRAALGGRTKHNTALHSFYSLFHTEAFRRVAIGIEHPISGIRFRPTAHHSLRNKPTILDKLYEVNKFPDEHWKFIHEAIVPKAFKAIDLMVNDIRKQIGPVKPEDPPQLSRMRPAEENPPEIIYKPIPDAAS